MSGVILIQVPVEVTGRRKRVFTTGLMILMIFQVVLVEVITAFFKLLSSLQAQFNKPWRKYLRDFQEFSYDFSDI